jgi:hypothetical protein
MLTRLQTETTARELGAKSFKDALRRLLPPDRDVVGGVGFCEQGKVGDFLGDDGARIAMDGSLPINTSGGQLSGGRLHGIGFLHEACVQLGGEGGDRQAPKSPEVVAVGVGGGPVAGRCC